MNNQGNIELLKVWRYMAEAIRKSHMSHEWRRDKMFILSAMMQRRMKYITDSGVLNTVAALEELLVYLRNEEYLTHTDVKNGLSFFVLMCDVQIEIWSPKPVSFAKAMAEELDELPF
jgi:hypothetical protein